MVRPFSTRMLSMGPSVEKIQTMVRPTPAPSAAQAPGAGLVENFLKTEIFFVVGVYLHADHSGFGSLAFDNRFKTSRIDGRTCD